MYFNFYKIKWELFKNFNKNKYFIIKLIFNMILRLILMIENKTDINGQI